MSSLCMSLGDTVRLKDSRIGIIRFIGRTTVKKTIFYGIHLKQNNGNHDGSMHNRRYFKCPPNYGIFVEKSFITEITKKHTISASFYHNQPVMVKDIGIGIIKYIGMTHFGNAYWYGIQLENKLNNNDLSKISNNNHIHSLSNIEIVKFHYFDCDENKSIFVRANQIKSARNREFRRREIHFNEKPMSPKIKYKIEEKEEKYDPYNNYINKTLISMMDSLNIPMNKRSEMLKMDNTNKLLMIQQWFITPNNKQLQKTMHKNIKERKKSQSLILLKKKNKKQNKSNIKINTPMSPMSPTQSSSNNLNFDGCDLRKKRNKKPKKSVKIKRKQSKSLVLLNIGKIKKSIPFYQKELKVKKSSKPSKLSKTLKTSKKSKTFVNTKRKKSHSLELNKVTKKKSNLNNKQRKSKNINYLKPKNMKHKNINKSKSASLLIKKSKLENVKKTKCINIKPKSKKKKKKKMNYSKRKQSKSAVLLIKKSDKYKLQKSNKKHIKIHSGKKKLPKNPKMKSKKSTSATLLNVKSKGRNRKKGVLTSSLKLKLKHNSNKMKKKKKKRKNRRVVDKLID